MRSEHCNNHVRSYLVRAFSDRASGILFGPRHLANYSCTFNFFHAFYMQVEIPIYDVQNKIIEYYENSFPNPLQIDDHGYK